MIHKIRQWFGLFAIPFFLIANAHAGEYFVAVGGSDSSRGSQRQPFRTIQKAADSMKPGDTCYVRAGVYRQIVIPKHSGTQGNPIRFAAWPGEVVTISGTEPVRG